ncbi:tyrosine-type recombinase/integrase [Clostridium magnum]|uniref:Putative prophage phiRv2 integrase n=1 Tax=Clostridium magnum DSM 2767 TaxID=1121326 RepID=A0A161WXM9_9CLOT|nr:tyrosine-type recombinase/integrase [Clostridium magnum]KZL91778.1 putative prophage phiRv2 integrase [Clostridium magnum DSM 2767]SHJ25549.1 Site-specific recombinase XerD [Clostridium magnum DSM 2767]
MTGGVRKRGSVWYYYFEVGAIGGKRKRIERRGGKTKKEAQTALAEAIVKFNTGYVEPKKETVGDYLNNWLENHIKENRKISTYHRYREFIRNNINPNIGNIMLKDIKPIHIENMILTAKRKKLSGTTLQSLYGVINSAFNKAVKLQVINNNPCKYIDRPKRDKFVASVLTVEEFNTIIDSLDETIYYDYAFKLGLNIVIELGLRRGELGGLEWENVDFNNHCINIKNNLTYSNGRVMIGTTKTDESERTLYISDNLIRILKEHKKIQNKNKVKYGPDYIDNVFNGKKFDFIMTWENGHYVHPNYYTSKFRKILNSMEFEKSIRFHDLRHTNASLLLEQGVDFKVIQTRLGHSDINTTLNIYSHINLKMQQNATEKLAAVLSGGKPVAKNKNSH